MLVTIVWNRRQPSEPEATFGSRSIVPDEPVEAFSQSRGIRSALEGIARNPGASGPITTTMIIGLALIESLVIYVLVVCLILLIVNPFSI